MFTRVFAVSLIVVVAISGLIQAQDVIEIIDEEVWDNLGAGGFDANDTLVILAGGKLTINGRSAIKEGMHLIVEEGGAFTMSARLDLDGDGVITMNGGTFTLDDELKFPDNNTGMDMISIGPDLRYPHSPDEKVSISAIGKVWDFMAELLKELKSADDLLA